MKVVEASTIGDLYNAGIRYNSGGRYNPPVEGIGGRCNLLAIAEIDSFASAVVSGRCDLIVNPGVVVDAMVSLESMDDLSASGDVIKTAELELIGFCITDAEGERILEGETGLSGDSLLSATGEIEKDHHISFELVFGPTTFGLNTREKRVRRLFATISKDVDARVFVSTSASEHGAYSREVSIGEGQELNMARKALPLAGGDPAGGHLYRVRVRGWGSATVHEIAVQMSARGR